MAEISIKNIIDKDTWEKFILSKNEANFLQSWNWGEFHKNLGNAIYRSGFYDNGNLLGIMLSVVETAKRGKYLTVGAGPIIDWGNQELVKSFLEEIKKIAKETGCVFVRVRPQLASNDSSKNIFKKLGFVNAPMHLHAELTSQLDIEKPEEELLANMRKTTRYEIKKAISLGIQIEASENPQKIKKFYELQMETAKRQKFVPFSFNFLHKQFEVFSKNNEALLYSAFYKNKLLAQAFIIFQKKEAVYHYGASTDEGRHYPGAYLIQWEAIKEAKRRGLTRYNFWGVAPTDNPNHRFAGLSLFKRGFGGVDVQYLHAQDLIINKPRYFINYLIELLRKKIRRV